jgi:hypothetical protein
MIEQPVNAEDRATIAMESSAPTALTMVGLAAQGSCAGDACGIPHPLVSD